MMNWKGSGRKRSWPNLRNYPRICPEGLRITTKNLSQDSRSLGRDLNLGPPEYETGLLSTTPQRSVNIVTGFTMCRQFSTYIRVYNVQAYSILSTPSSRVGNNNKVICAWSPPYPEWNECVITWTSCTIICLNVLNYEDESHLGYSVV
jgi:hypothetical protein